MIYLKNYEYKFTDHISEDEWLIRYEVFIDEQQFSYDYDDLDTDPAVTHTVLYADGSPAATGRLIPLGNGEFAIGRAAVRKKYRGCGLGSEILHILEKEALRRGGIKTVVSAQLRAKEFYAKSGYTPVSGVFYEEYCKHIRMEKNL